MKKVVLFILLFIVIHRAGMAQHRVGIGTFLPMAGFHVADSSVLFTGPEEETEPSNVGLPSLGAGIRFHWMVQAGALRVGTVSGMQWDAMNIGVASIAFGSNTLASGGYSVAMGAASSATGYASMAFGDSVSSTGSGSLAVGVATKSTNLGAVALGYESEANGLAALAAGGAKANGDYSVGLGAGVANGSFATAVGGAKASGHFSLAGGLQSEARGVGALAFGQGLLAKAADAVVWGSFNDTTDNPGLAGAATDRIFQIGIGTGSDPLLRKNALTLLRNGKLGIGTLAPTEALHVVGNITYTGSAFQTSDASLKTNLQPLSAVLAKLQQLNGYQYQWKNEAADAGWQIGLMAQEIQKVWPQLVKETGEGKLAVNYTGLIPVLVEAIKELQQQVEALKREK
jgi:hypothetical protein